MTLKMKPTARTRTIKGSTFKPWASSVYNFSMVDEEPPAPADLAEVGSSCFLSKFAALLLANVLCPPGIAVDFKY